MDIRLRNAKLTDAWALCQVIIENRPYLTNMVWAANAELESTKEFLRDLEKKNEFFQLILLDDMIVGTITLRLHKSGQYEEIGYWLCNSARGKGVMKEAVRRMLYFAAPVVRAVVRTENDASIAVLRANGFVAKSIDESGQWMHLQWTR